MMNPGKLALCLAIPFALAACSGGGGELTIPAIPTIPVEVSLKPLPTQPAQPEQPGGTGGTGQPEDGTPQPTSGAAKFFPLKADHLSRMDLEFYGAFRDGPVTYDGRITFNTRNPRGTTGDHLLEGKTALDALVPSILTSEWDSPPPKAINIPQFSEFSFGDSETLNGIPVQQRATAEQATRYAAYAYQAILEHSAHIFQTGMHHNLSEYGYGDTGFSSLPYVAILSTGEKVRLAEGSSGISGKWTGKAFGIEGHGGQNHHLGLLGGLIGFPTLDSTEARLVTADVDITANIFNSADRFPDSELNMRFYNWKGSENKAANGRRSNADDYDELLIGGNVRLIEPRIDNELGQGGIDYVAVGDTSPSLSNDLVARSRIPEGKGWFPRKRGARLQFYGPDGAEVAGYWWANWAERYGDHNNFTQYYIVEGGFVAKK